MTILITGAQGFVGSALCARLDEISIPYRIATRSKKPRLSCEDIFAIEDINERTNWTKALVGVQQIIHLAARVHIMRETSDIPIDEFRRVNVQGTAKLARQAVEAGVKRFIYISSIKVNGDSTSPGLAFSPANFAAPEDSYGISKYEAECILWQIASKSDMEVVVIRPPMIYGQGVKGNFELMMRWIARGIPLPLAAVNDNRRSLLGLGNFVDLIATCIYHPFAANQTFFVSDGEDMSTVELLNRIASAMGVHLRLFYVHPKILRFGANILGKEPVFQRLYGSLQIDIEKTKQLLNWQPSISFEEEFQRNIDGISLASSYSKSS